MLRDAFLRYVLQDESIAEVSARLLEARPQYSSIFREGQAPGPTVNFCGLCTEVRTSSRQSSCTAYSSFWASHCLSQRSWRE